MITTQPTRETLEKWKQAFDRYCAAMLPNRKTGEEIDQYFRARYPYQPLESEAFASVVKANIMENEHARQKLPPGTPVQIRSYVLGNIYVGIDISSGEFHVECEEIEKAVPIYNDLFVYRGLDAEDLKNFVMVGQFIELTRTQTPA